MGKGALNLLLDTSHELPELFRSPLTSRQKIAVSLEYLKVSIKLFTLHRIKKIHKENILGFTVYTFDYGAFHFLFREIFVKNSYFFRAERKKNINVFDCGANIGMATLYFKWLYPHANIYSFEPDPATFLLLEKNIKENRLKNVSTYNIALHSKNGNVKFYVDHKNPGWLTMSTNQDRLPGKDVIQVPAAPLTEFIKGKIDFMKMDIEGAETIVFKELLKSKKIENVSEIILEFHSKKNIPEINNFLNLFSKKKYFVEIAAERNVTSSASQDILIRLTR